jgi:hypothetical protein
LFHYLLTYGAEPFLRRCLLCSHSGTSQDFKEPECSSPCSQEPSTGPYPEPDRSSPYHFHPISLRSILIYPPTYVLVFLVVSFFLPFPPISYMHSSPTPFVLHALFILIVPLEFIINITMLNEAMPRQIQTVWDYEVMQLQIQSVWDYQKSRNNVVLF